jgi:hypothetical protein
MSERLVAWMARRGPQGRIGAAAARRLAVLIGALVRVPTWVASWFIIHAACDMLPGWAATNLRVDVPDDFTEAGRRYIGRIAFAVVRIVTGKPDHTLRALRRCRAPNAAAPAQS